MKTKTRNIKAQTWQMNLASWIPESELWNMSSDMKIWKRGYENWNMISGILKLITETWKAEVWHHTPEIDIWQLDFEKLFLKNWNLINENRHRQAAIRKLKYDIRTPSSELWHMKVEVENSHVKTERWNVKYDAKDPKLKMLA